MNLTLHLLKKDVTHFRWTLSAWLLSLGYLLVQSNLRLAEPGHLRDYLQLTALLLLLVSGFVLIAGVVQADHPAAPEMHWRTRPVSAWRLLVSKLLFVGLVFVVVPLVAGWLRSLAVSKDTFNSLAEYGLVILILGALTLSVMAVAACTRNVVYCLLFWLGLIFLGGTLADLLDRFSPVLSRQALAVMGLTKVLLILGLSVAVALAVLMNQYLRRRMAVSIALLAFGSVGSALIGTMWGYFYFYSSQ